MCTNNHVNVSEGCGAKLIRMNSFVYRRDWLGVDSDYPGIRSIKK